MTHPDVFLDLPLTFDSLHKTVDQIVTVPFLRNFIGRCHMPRSNHKKKHRSLSCLTQNFWQILCASFVDSLPREP